MKVLANLSRPADAVAEDDASLAFLGPKRRVRNHPFCAGPDLGENFLEMGCLASGKRADAAQEMEEQTR